MNKRLMAVLLGLLTGIPVVYAAPFGGMFGRVFDKIISIGDLSWLGAPSSSVGLGFTRILIWILLFTVFFAVAAMLNPGKDKGKPLFSRSQAMTIAAIVATISSIFLPPAILIATGSGFATLIALALVGGPIIGILLLLWNIPGRGGDKKQLPETKGDTVLKLFIVAILFWVLSVVVNHLGTGDPVTTAVTDFAEYGLSILTFMIMYYIVKFFMVPNNRDEDPNAEWAKHGANMRGALGNFLKKSEDKNTAENKRLANAAKERKEKSEAEHKRHNKEIEAKANRDARHNVLNPAKGFLYKARNNLSDVAHLLSNGVNEKSIEDSKDKIKRALRNVASARRNLRSHRHHFRHNVNALTELVAHMDHLGGEVNKLNDHVPANDEGYSEFLQEERAVITAIDVAISEIDELIEEENHRVRELEEHHNQERASERVDDQVQEETESNDDDGSGDGTPPAPDAAPPPGRSPGRSVRPRARVRPRR